MYTYIHKPILTTLSGFKSWFFEKINTYTNLCKKRKEEEPKLTKL